MSRSAPPIIRLARLGRGRAEGAGEGSFARDLRFWFHLYVSLRLRKALSNKVTRLRHPSIATMAIRGLVTVFSIRTLINALAILGLGHSAPTRLCRSDSILVPF